MGSSWWYFPAHLLTSFLYKKEFFFRKWLFWRQKGTTCLVESPKSFHFGPGHITWANTAVRKRERNNPLWFLLRFSAFSLSRWHSLWLVSRPFFSSSKRGRPSNIPHAPGIYNVPERETGPPEEKRRKVRITRHCISGWKALPLSFCFLASVRPSIHPSIRCLLFFVLLRQ